MFKVLLYYKFTNIDNPKEFRDLQLSLCKSLNIKGRILIGSEGINGTVAGTEESIDKYISETKKYPGLEDIEWKISFSEENVFPKLRVVVRDEIVTFRAKVDINKRAKYINPEELSKLYESSTDFVILDGRNEYEGRIGKFKNAIVPDIKNFRDFPEWFEKNKELLKGKKVITYCTGGIRCEKLSAYLVQEGIEDVSQLHGGIVTYGEVTGGKDFLGTCYVFDKRIHVDVNSVNPKTISECEHCSKNIARYINCCNALCNKQFICCEECDIKFDSGCSVECQKKSRYK